MNTSLSSTLVVVTILTIPVGVFAAGSKINNTTITNKANIKNSANVAIVGGFGKAEANQGSIVVKGAKVTNSNIINNAKITNSANVAIAGGGRAEANQGVIKINKSLNGVTVVNEANIKNSANVAVDAFGIGGLLGTNESNQGSIIFK